MTDAPAPASDDRQEAVPHLDARLADVDAQPLEERTEAYAVLHDELRSVLEDGSPSAGGTVRGPVPGHR